MGACNWYIPRSVRPGVKPDTKEFLQANADYQSIGPSGPQKAEAQIEVTSFRELSFPSWGVHPSDDTDAQEAEFGDAESGKGPPHQWL